MATDLWFHNKTVSDETRDQETRRKIEAQNSVSKFL